MYTHIGDGLLIKSKNIIGIFDKKSIDESRQNKRIQYEMKNLKDKDKINSIILVEEDNEYKEVFSKISVATLKKRVEKGIFQTKER